MVSPQLYLTWALSHWLTCVIRILLVSKMTHWGQWRWCAPAQYQAQHFLHSIDIYILSGKDGESTDCLHNEVLIESSPNKTIYVWYLEGLSVGFKSHSEPLYNSAISWYYKLIMYLLEHNSSFEAIRIYFVIIQLGHMPYLGDCAKGETFHFKVTESFSGCRLFFFSCWPAIKNVELFNISLLGWVKHPRNLQGGLQCIDNEEISWDSAYLALHTVKRDGIRHIQLQWKESRNKMVKNALNNPVRLVSGGFFAGIPELLQLDLPLSSHFNVSYSLGGWNGPA